MNKIILFCVAFLASLSICQGQSSYISIKGCVCDEVTKLPIPFVNVIVQETYSGTITDENGKFALDSLKIGEYHLHFSHIGCEAKQVFLDSKRDTILTLELSHSVNSLGTVNISGKERSLTNVPNVVINRKKIEDNTNQNLASLLAHETGVSLLKNGSGISKPIVHGLYGNRLLLLNNGVALSGQQWGNDHAPEIDPFAADKITVVKGASAIAYGGGNLGSVVLIEPKSIVKEPHFHGLLNYAYESNGRGNTFNTRFEKASDSLAWRFTATVKNYGDRKAPNYYLNNTGTEEANLAFQLEKSWNDKTYLDVYASSFNSRLGLLRGSILGNTTDLEYALRQDIPFFTEPDFSSEIEAPKQHVSHHFLKAKLKHQFNEAESVEAVLAAQINDRKEFDIRRGGRSDTPVMNLLQYTFNIESKYNRTYSNDWKLQLGNQSVFTDNTNVAGTGTLPLIPNYFSFKNGIFGVLTRDFERSFLSFGARYDYEFQNIAYNDRDIQRSVLKFDNQFHNMSASLSYKYEMTPTQSLTLNSGFASRNPAINELYSYGLHQGVSGIEEGDFDLKVEKAFKNTLDFKWYTNPNLTLNTVAYHQYFKDYIYLQPQEELRLTIRGAFPVFVYEQTDAQIFGMDVSSQFNFSNSFFGILKYSYLRGRDIENDRDLIFMPPNRIFSSFTYHFPRDYRLKKSFKVADPEIELYNRYVFEQKNTKGV
ncbi:MAG: TonB-dependent receptor, partial [Flavicella sp.]